MIRYAESERDAAACAAIYRPHVEDAATSFEEISPDAADFARRIEAVSTRYPWLVAERDGIVVGFAYATPHRERAAYRWTAETSVYVADGDQRHGLGGSLYRALLDLLRRQRLHVALAGITLPNAASVGLHEALGFEPVGVYRSVGYKAGAWRDVGWWQLALAGAQGAPLEPLGPQKLGDG
ncbi:MAG TPA: arsinothricin resistance N-acetyltransferase ArsN1 family B [Thermoleophilaceae bacterium]|nr:arsinothricin resistance N-acetyltransferase ArsN1 family B [Thermoleophilaceae bacterium]